MSSPRVGYNKNSSAIKRIMQEARELANDPCTDYTAAPLEDDIFEWHCTIRGTPDTEFEGGLYHFRILLPSEYPFRPPSIMMLTPNGRFELNTKICISFTNYHEELWQPAWGVRTAILGLQGFFPLKGTAAVGVGALEYPATERKRLATLSREWTCPRCNKSNLECLPDPEPSSAENSAEEHNGNVTDASQSTETPLAESVSNKSQPESKEASNIATPIPAPNTPSPSTPVSIEVSTPPVRVFAPTPNRPIVPVSIVSSRTPSTPESRSTSTPTSSEQTRLRGSPAPHSVLIPRSPPRPPIVLDTVICILLVLVFALVCRRIL
ncbi:ubiquitin-conjugating enzyme/RWD-like protein [Abortiporus biennis]|nr:ubiquitin-conjugating enzyme/RWD-like protein [Abortiporus biennis]